MPLNAPSSSSLSALSVSQTKSLLKSAALALPLLFSLSQISAAQDASNDDEVVVTGSVSTFGATKSDIPILETARSISVISADEFLERGALTIDDALNYTAGVVGDTFGFSTRGDFPRVRGLDIPEYLDNIQVLFGNYNNTRSDVYTLEQIEVLKGPASVLYGQGSPGGVLNTISKQANKDYLSNEITLEYGTHNRAQIGGDFGLDLSGDGEWTARLVGVYRDSDTQIDLVEDNALVIAPSVTFQNDRTRVTALVNYSERNGDTAQQFTPLTISGCQSDDVTIDAPTVCADAPLTAPDSGLNVGDPNFSDYDTKSTSITLFLEQELTENLRFEATARQRNSDAEYRQAWITFLGNGVPRVTSDGTARARSWYDSISDSEQFAIDARFRAHVDTGPLSHEILAGINHQNVGTTQQAAYLYGLPTTFNVFNPVYDGSEVPDSATVEASRGDDFSDLKSTGYYINDQMSVGDFVLTAGVRFDEFENISPSGTAEDDAISTSFGALYKSPIGLNPYISYAESFNPVIGVDNVTGDPLKPQEGEQIEFGVKYQPAGLPIYLTAAYFEIEQSNLANPSALTGQDIPSQQEGVAKIDGFEIQAQAKFGDFDIDGSLSMIDTQDPDGDRFTSIPEDQASVWGGWSPSAGPLTGFRLGAGARYFGHNVSDFVRTEGATLIDGMIGYDFDDVSVTLNARNIFDKEYYGTCLSRGDCFIGESRTVVGRVAYRF